MALKETLGGVVSSLGTVATFAKEIVEMKTEVAVNEKAAGLLGAVINAQGLLLAAQAERATLIEELEELKRENRRLNAWEAEKERYELVLLGEGTPVYRIKKSSQGGEPVHYICPKCFSDSETGMLAYSGITNGHKSYVCARCRQTYLGERVPAFAEISDGSGVTNSMRMF